MLLLWALNNPSEAALLSGSWMVLALVVSSWIGAFLHQKDRASKPRVIGSILLSPVLTLKLRFNAWRFLLRGPTMIQAAYEKVRSWCLHSSFLLL